MKAFKAVVCLLVALGVAVPVLAQPYAQVTAVILKVSYQKFEGGLWSRAKVGTKLHAGARIRTGKRSKCELRFPDGGRIRMNQRTDLTIGDADAKNVKLDKGNLYARIIAGTGARIKGAESVATVKGTTIAYDGQVLTTYVGTATHEMARGDEDVGAGTASDVHYPGVYRVPGEKWAGGQLRPWFDTIKAGVTTKSTPGTSIGQRVKQTRRELVTSVQSVLSPPEAVDGGLSMVVLGVGTRAAGVGGATSGLGWLAAGLPTAAAFSDTGGHGEPMIDDKFFGPYWDAQAFAILGEGQNNLVGGQLRGSIMGGDLFFGFGAAGHSDFPGDPVTHLNEAFATYRYDTWGDLTVGRQYFLEGPINNSRLGSLFDFDLGSAARWQVDLGACAVDLAYLWDTMPVSQIDRHGWAGRLQTDVLDGVVAANVLYDHEMSDTGWSFDWSVPVWPENVDFYGEFGEDPTGHDIQTWGAYFPGLYQSNDVDLFIEHAKRDAHPSLTSASLYWDLGKGWTGLLLAKDRSGEDTIFGIGIAKELSNR